MSDLWELIERAQARGPIRLKPSKVELDVLNCLSQGLTEKMTADVLRRPYFTVRQQNVSARMKLAAKNVPHAIAICFRQGWLS